MIDFLRFIEFDLRKRFFDYLVAQSWHDEFLEVEVFTTDRVRVQSIFLVHKIEDQVEDLV